MSNFKIEAINEMHAFYEKDNPTEEEQFRFVEAMKYLIDTAVFPDDIMAFSYNLAMYYRDIREFQLEKKYLEMGAVLNDSSAKEQLGCIWYYGLCGERNFEKAFQYFSESRTRTSRYMLADMYHYGYYVKQNSDESRKILEKLYIELEEQSEDSRFLGSTVFPEVAFRLVILNMEDRKASLSDYESLIKARKILVVRQQRRPFWGNLKIMKAILRTMVNLTGNESLFSDLYDLLIFDSKRAMIKFTYHDQEKQLKLFENQGEVIYEFDGKWFHGAEDFLEKAKLGTRRITSILDEIINIHIF